MHRQTNVSLLQTYGANAWRIHNYLLETTAKNAEKALEELKEQITGVNRERKNTQVRLLLRVLCTTNSPTLTDQAWGADNILGASLRRADLERTAN